MVAGGDVAAYHGVAYYFGITFHRHSGVLVGAVDDGHHGLAIILASHYINAVVRQELGLLALGNHVVAWAFAPVEQGA